MLKSWETQIMKEELKNSSKRPLWFTFPGSIAYYEGAGREPMRIPAFAATIKRAAAILQPLGIDLIWILTEAPEAVFEDIINIMVSIIGMQIALVDVLHSVGLDSDAFFGASLGEIGAVYADETLTVEQAMLVAYSRGHCMIEIKVPVGPKAILYTPIEQFAKCCPSDIDIIILLVDSVVVAGPEISIKDIVNVFRSEGKQAKIVGEKLLQFHSRYVDNAASSVIERLKPIICNPKPHTHKWISTSMPAEKWESETGTFIDAEFFGNNMRAPIDLITPVRKIPKNAVVVEMSANAKVLGSLKQNMPATVTTIELFFETAVDPVENLFEAVKKIYELTGRQPPPLEQMNAAFGKCSKEKRMMKKIHNDRRMRKQQER